MVGIGSIPINTYEVNFEMLISKSFSSITVLC